RWLDADARHRMQAAHWLADAGAIDLPVASLSACLMLPAADERASSFRFPGPGDADFPWPSDARRFLHPFRRWGWLPAARDGDAALLAEIHRIDSYRSAARRLGVPLPTGDSRASLLFDGTRWAR